MIKGFSMRVQKSLYTKFSLALFLFFNITLVFSQTSEDNFLYTVKKNDTIWDVCNIYVQDPLCWKSLVTYNQIENPKLLAPNSIVKIPNSWLITNDASALVIAVEGVVGVVRTGIPGQKKLVIGDRLSQNDVVEALNGTAMIKFADQSRLLLKENSTIRMASLQFYNSNQLVETRIELLKGRVNSQVEKIVNPKSVYEIFTPAAVAAVRGTEFRVSRTLDSKGNVVMSTELLSGALEIKNSTQSVNITAGQAAIATENSQVSVPIKLLSRPLVVLSERQNFELTYDIQWQPVLGAISYKINLIHNDSQIWEVTTKETSFVVENVPSGSYKLLVRGIDARNIEGKNRQLFIDVP